MTHHYFNGAYYPRGGGKSLSRAQIRELRRRGGEIRTRTRVARIIVQQRRAVGVEIDGGEIVRAESVVCNADPAVTYGRLLGAEHCPRQLRQVKRMTYSVGLLSAFCAVDMDLAAMGYDSGNYWWYRDADVGGVYARMEKGTPGAALDGLFLTITTLKDPRRGARGHHTVEMFTFVPYAAFERWSDTRGDRAHDLGYQALKRELGEKMIVAAENIIPGLRDKLTFMELGTPLTSNFYCETYRGASYGTAKTPWQLGPFSFHQRGPVERLYLCGASTLSHGVAGASMSGLFAAQYALGRATAEELLGPADGTLRVYPADRAEEWLPRKLTERVGPNGRARS
jgi:phytoene dehydrogenase-like protein